MLRLEDWETIHVIIMQKSLPGSHSIYLAEIVQWHWDDYDTGS